MEGSRLQEDVCRLAGSLGKLPEPSVRPVLIVVSGLPGTGKTYVSARLREALGFTVLESDALRKALVGTPVYSPGENARLFMAINLLIEELLKKGISLIMDATNLSERTREKLYRIAEQVGARLIMVMVEAPPEVVMERLKTRSASGGTFSDADWGVYLKLRPALEKIKRNHYFMDTSKDISPVLDKIIRDARR